jgi:hypothetical protein
MADSGGYLDFFRVRFKQDRVIDGHYRLIYISVRMMLFMPSWVVVTVPRAQIHRVAQPMYIIVPDFVMKFRVLIIFSNLKG